MFFNKKQNKKLLDIQLLDDNEYTITLGKNLSHNNIIQISNFIFLLTYKNSISIDIINHMKDNICNNKEHVDNILSSWANMYFSDKNTPIVNPLLAFKQNVK